MTAGNTDPGTLMPTRSPRSVVIATLRAMVLGGSVVAASPATSEAPAIGEERVLRRHLSHAEIAAGIVDLSEVIAVGRHLFTARFTHLDGAGRPAATAAEVPTRRPVGASPDMLRTSGPDANACSGCHNQPFAGGAGDFVANVFVAPQDIEYDFDSVAPDLSMERGTVALHGAGLLELLAREMTEELLRQRDQAVSQARQSGLEVRTALSAKGVSFGWLTARPDGIVDTDAVEGVHPDLIVKPFGQKAVVISLRQFSVTAYNQHHGMQPAERFGPRWTGEADFDQDGHALELTEGDITAAVLFQATLPPPIRAVPGHPALRAAAARGESLFMEIGCGSCHNPELVLDDAVFVEPGPHNPAGTLRDRDGAGDVAVDLADLWGDGIDRTEDGRLIVRAYTDLKRHRIADPATPFYANETITQNFVPRDRFRTAPLWGVGSTAPYGHRGDLGTLREAIAHHGGEAAAVRAAFDALPEADRAAVIEFLKSLQIPAAPDMPGQRADRAGLAQ